MNNRRIAREIAMQVLFQWEAQKLIERKNLNAPKIAQGLDIDIALSQYIGSFYKKNKAPLNTNFSAQIIIGTLHSLVNIDKLIENASSNWKLERMDAIDRAILRIACFELAIRKEISPNAIMNEAIEIAKRYGTEHSASFVNGILENIKKTVGR